MTTATLERSRRWFELRLEDKDGRAYTGRITGTCIAEQDDTSVYLADDGRVLLYDGAKLQYWDVTDDPESELRASLSGSAYIDAMLALGETPVIQLRPLRS